MALVQLNTREEMEITLIEITILSTELEDMNLIN